MRSLWSSRRSVRAARYLAQADVRRRWRSVAVLTLLVGVAGGVVLGAVAGARRTASSFDRFAEQSRTSDVFVLTGRDDLSVSPVKRLANVEAVAVLAPLAAEVVADTYIPVAASVDGRFGRVMDRPRLLAGRRTPPGAVDEVAVSESTAKVLRVGVGDYFTVQTFTPEQMALFDPGQGNLRGEGPTVRLRVVGIERAPADVGTSFEQNAVLVLPPGFLRVYGDRIGSFAPLAFRARLTHGPADAAGFIRAVRRIYGQGNVEIQPVSFESAAIQDQLGVLSAGLFAFAAVAALAGAVAIGQSLARQMSLGMAQHPALLAMGMTGRERAAALLGPAAVVAVGGMVIAIALSAAASPLMPVGVARRAEPDPGLSFDAPMLVGGGAALVVLVLVFAAIAAWRLTRQASFAAQRGSPARPSAVGRKLAGAGMTPAAVTGVRMALEAGRGRTAVPVRATLIGTTVGVVGVVATLVFAAGLDRLVDHPSRYGWNWDVLASTQVPAEDLRRDPAVAGLTEARFNTLEIGGHATNVVGVRRIEGAALPTVIEGRGPRRKGEVALGHQTLAELDVTIGDPVEASGPDGRGSLRVVGVAVFASVDDRAVLAEGALLTERGLAHYIANDDDGAGGYRVYLVRFAKGADVRAAHHRIARASGEPVEHSRLPPEVDHLTHIDRLPFVLGGFLALLAVAALLHALVTSLLRRRRDLAVLAALGFVRRQIQAAVVWQASTIALIGLLVGIPVGVVVGRLAWGRVAEGLGVATDAAVPTFALALAVPIVLVVAVLVAVLPARAAARTRFGVVLRAD